MQTTFPDSMLPRRQDQRGVCGILPEEPLFMLRRLFLFDARSIGV